MAADARRRVLTVPYGGASPAEDGEALTVVEVDLTGPAAVAGARALLEAELAELVAGNALEALELLLDELATRALDPGLLPLHVTARRHETHLSVEVQFRGGAAAVRRVLDELLPESGGSWALTLVDHFAESYGVDLSGGSGTLWCRVCTL